MQHLSVNLERACVIVLNLYHVTKNTCLDEIKGEYSISHASYHAYFVILVACMAAGLKRRSQVTGRKDNIINNCDYARENVP